MSTAAAIETNSLLKKAISPPKKFSFQDMVRTEKCLICPGYLHLTLLWDKTA